MSCLIGWGDFSISVGKEQLRGRAVLGSKCEEEGGGGRWCACRDGAGVVLGMYLG